MIIAYYSRTGNVRDFLDWYFPEYETRNIEVWDADAPFVLVMPTYSFGNVPEEVDGWIERNDYFIMDGFMKGIVGSGNRNFGSAWFCNGAKTVAQTYDVPLLHTFELKGSPTEAEIVRKKIDEL